MTLCRFHHRIHHTGQLGIAGNADIQGCPGEAQEPLDERVFLHPTAQPLRFTDVRGKVLREGARPTTPPVDQSASEAAAAIGTAPTKPYVHPLGERQTWWGVTINKNRPEPEPPPEASHADDADDPSGHAAIEGCPDPTAMPASARDGGPPTGTSPPA